MALISGDKYGRLTVIDKAQKGMYNFKCDCGKLTQKLGNSVKHGNIKSCGCLAKISGFVDNTGKRYGMLTVAGHVEGLLWRCTCDCGGEIVVSKTKLFQRRVVNCGCQESKPPSKKALYGGDNRKYGRVNYDWHIMIGAEKLKLRSSYEVIYAQYLIREGIHFEYEPKRFKLDGGDYVPDFYLPERDIWVELKGIMTAESQSRIDRFIASTGYKLVVIGEDEINDYLPDGINYNKFLRAWRKRHELVKPGLLSSNEIILMNDCSNIDFELGTPLTTSDQLPDERKPFNTCEMKMVQSFVNSWN